MSSTKKRFIAGAVCPKCGKMDTVMMYTDDGQQHRECVDCGFNDVLHIQSQPNELRTRVNAAEVYKGRDAPQPVQLKGFQQTEPKQDPEQE